MTINFVVSGSFPGGSPSRGGMHVGQASPGRRFLFRAHSSLGITTFPDWEHFLRTTKVSIRTTSGREVTVDELVQRMTATTDGGRLQHKRFRSAGERRYVTSGGDCFCRYDFF